MKQDTLREFAELVSPDTSGSNANQPEDNYAFRNTGLMHYGYTYNIQRPSLGAIQYIWLFNIYITASFYINFSSQFSNIHMLMSATTPPETPIATLPLHFPSFHWISHFPITLIPPYHCKVPPLQSCRTTQGRMSCQHF